LLDRDLAELYGVSTRALNQAVKRNARRFPPDFMFRLTKKEKDELVTNCDRFLSHRAPGNHRENILKIFRKSPLSAL
jgi:hypothetical protein